MSYDIISRHHHSLQHFMPTIIRGPAALGHFQSKFYSRVSVDSYPGSSMAIAFDPYNTLRALFC